jgi:hypothetical protein
VVPGKERPIEKEKVFVPPMFAAYENKLPVTKYRKLKPLGVSEVPNNYIKFIDPVYEEK